MTKSLEQVKRENEFNVTSDKALILERAVEMWSDRKHRVSIIFRDNQGQKYCALGVVTEAAIQITGTFPDLYGAARLVGFESPGRVMELNDAIPFGKTYLYWRMKKELKKAKELDGSIRGRSPAETSSLCRTD